jgi:hypothetical protein
MISVLIYILRQCCTSTVKNGFILGKIYFQNPIHILYVYFIKGFSIQTQLQIPFHLYSRVAEDDGSNVKIEWIW